MLAIAKQNITRDRNHINFVKTLPCLVCGQTPCDAHHIRRGSNSGVGIKPGDNLTIPLCHAHHMEVHNVGELTCLYKIGGWEKCKVLAKQLYEVTGDYEKAYKLIGDFRNG